MIVKCIDCQNDCKIDYSGKITVKGEDYFKATCNNCGKIQWVKDDTINEISVKINLT